jgi:hypothetical protein
MIDQGQYVPELRTLCLAENIHLSSVVSAILPPLTASGRATIVFPHLQELRLLHCGPARFDETDEFYVLLRNFILARRGAIRRLVIPPLKNTEIIGFLKANVAHVEVCQFTLSLLPPFILKYSVKFVNEPFCEEQFFHTKYLDGRFYT